MDTTLVSEEPISVVLRPATRAAPSSRRPWRNEGYAPPTDGQPCAVVLSVTP